MDRVVFLFQTRCDGCNITWAKRTQHPLHPRIGDSVRCNNDPVNRSKQTPHIKNWSKDWLACQKIDSATCRDDPHHSSWRVCSSRGRFVRPKKTPLRTGGHKGSAAKICPASWRFSYRGWRFAPAGFFTFLLTFALNDGRASPRAVSTSRDAEE